MFAITQLLYLRPLHMLSRRNCDSDCSDGEEDFYYTEIKLNTDSVADGLSSLSPVSPSILSPPSPLPPLSQPPDSHRPLQPSDAKEPHAGGITPLSRSAPSALYLVHTDHAYQVSVHTHGYPAKLTEWTYGFSHAAITNSGCHSNWWSDSPFLVFSMPEHSSSSQCLVMGGF